MCIPKGFITDSKKTETGAFNRLSSLCLLIDNIRVKGWPEKERSFCGKRFPYA